MTRSLFQGALVSSGPRGPAYQNTDQTPAERITVLYHCGDCNHELQLSFAAQADVPDTWPCPQPRCEQHAQRVDQPPAEHPTDPELHKPAYATGSYTRWHRQAILNRRTPEELNALLEERLEALRGAREQ